MIFVTVGTAGFQFNRLLEMFDVLIDEGRLQPSEVFAQIGYSTYIPRNYKYVKFTDKEQHNSLLMNADCVVSHAGTGTITSALKMNKVVIAVPRLSKYGEHVDDHQIQLIEVFLEKRYIMTANTLEEMKDCLDRINTFEKVKFVSNNKYINELIINYIDDLGKQKNG